MAVSDGSESVQSVSKKHQRHLSVTWPWDVLSCLIDLVVDWNSPWRRLKDSLIFSKVMIER